MLLFSSRWNTVDQSCLTRVCFNVPVRLEQVTFEQH